MSELYLGTIDVLAQDCHEAESIEPVTEADEVDLSEGSSAIGKSSYLTVFVIGLYMAVSVGAVFLNRSILSDKVHRPGPLFVAWYQLVVSYLMIRLLSLYGCSVRFLDRFPRVQFKKDIILKVLPVSVAFLSMICLNNQCLAIITISQYEIVKSLSVMFTVVFTYFVLGDSNSCLVCLACDGVIIGFVMCIETEMNMKWRGGFYGVWAAISMALYLVLIKWTLARLDNNEYILVECRTLITIVMLLPVVLINGEFGVLFRVRSLWFWLVLTFSGVVGFVVDLTIVESVRCTTPLSHNMAGVAKASVQIFLTNLVSNFDEMTELKFAGMVIVIVFTIAYTSLRKGETKEVSEEGNETEPLPVVQVRVGPEEAFEETEIVLDNLVAASNSPVPLEV